MVMSDIDFLSDIEIPDIVHFLISNININQYRYMRWSDIFVYCIVMSFLTSSMMSSLGNKLFC